METEIIVRRSGQADPRDIKHKTEQNFLTFLQRKFPTWTIEYEAQEFRAPIPSNGNGGKKREALKMRGTNPDFHIIKDDGTEIFLEITTSSRRGNPKGRNKRIMSQFEEKYRVLYAEHLINIEKKHKVQIIATGRYANGNGTQNGLNGYHKP